PPLCPPRPVPLAYCFAFQSHFLMSFLIPSLSVIQLTPPITLLYGFPAHSISLLPTAFIPSVAFDLAFLMPSPMRLGNFFAPSTMLLNCFLTPCHISPAKSINLVFRLRTLESILPTKELAMLLRILSINVVNLFLTLFHIVDILLRKSLENAIIFKMILPIKLFFTLL